MQTTLTGSLLGALLFLSVADVPLAAQGTPRTGADIYQANCAACHGADGRGATQSSIAFTDVGLPDFTDCVFTTPEPDADWAATIHLGGAARAFNRKMPAFVDAMSDTEIDLVIGHLRTFCTQPSWPRGDLNLPRPLVTEKAFPENESLVTTVVSPDGDASVENQFVYERRIGRRSQYEAVIPFNFQQQAGGWNRGLGDIALALKHALFDDLRRGTILSAGGEMTFPTGKDDRGLGGGVTIAETFVTVSQLLPRDGFLHVHGGFEFPLKSADPNEAYWRTAVGRTFSQQRWGRAWSPMLEVLGLKELGVGEAPQWDVVPQMQVTLSRRQHVMVDAGVRIPITERSARHPAFMMYFLWDWFDGGLLEGWR
ncbi:MAG TPA: c-type cytochrome [Vicinamibacterales bacterium]|nr:c-type cytochrome [Vicinamibacterales bacterium]